MQQALYFLLCSVFSVKFHIESLATDIYYLVIVSELPSVGIYVDAVILFYGFKDAREGEAVSELMLQ